MSITLTSLRTESGRGQNINSESMVLNVSGRLLMVQRESRNGDRYTCSMPTVLASCVENVWVPGRRRPDKVIFVKVCFCIPATNTYFFC